MFNKIFIMQKLSQSQEGMYGRSWKLVAVGLDIQSSATVSLNDCGDGYMTILVSMPSLRPVIPHTVCQGS